MEVLTMLKNVKAAYKALSEANELISKAQAYIEDIDVTNVEDEVISESLTDLLGEISSSALDELLDELEYFKDYLESQE